MRMNQEQEEQFTMFVAARWQRLVGLASLLTRDRGHAEDLVQTALAGCYRQWPKVMQGGREDAYVRTAVVNAYLSSVRRKRFKEILTFQLPDRSTENVHEPTEQRDLLRRALQELAPRARTAVVLRHYSQLSEAETAAMMSCSVGNVKRLTSDGLRELRKQMTTPQGPPVTVASSSKGSR
jgi:RNA polymerase sigma-70 factor (sigma-E family)